ncbi:DUF3859 domain-containing protein [Thalassotalea aquiviva]|uniref:DUF3859 domain-containing protein n=1 Tax=Thalassotalea aquiviva TaxID=3242415 RepID=UPI00352B22F2
MMPKSKSIYSVVTYGIYEQWDKSSKDLAKLLMFNTEVPALIDIEFGFVLKAAKGKGKELSYCIEHCGII